MLDGVGAVLLGLAALVTASPRGVRAYIDLRKFHDKRIKEGLPGKLATVSPPITFSRRSAGTRAADHSGAQGVPPPELGLL